MHPRQEPDVPVGQPREEAQVPERLRAVQRTPAQLLDHGEQRGGVSRWWHPDDAHMALDRKALVLDPSRTATPRPRHDQALPKSRHPVEAVIDMAVQITEPKPAATTQQRVAVKDQQRTDVLGPPGLGPQHDLVLGAQRLVDLFAFNPNTFHADASVGTPPLEATVPPVPPQGTGTLGPGARWFEGATLEEVQERCVMAGIAIEDVKAVDDRVDEILARWAAVGLAVGVVRGGRLVHFRGHGVADLKTRDPITPDTVFRVASITKTFTAVAIAQLWERGLVDLDAPAMRYLRSYRLVPARPGISSPTVRHLLTHTSGIPELASASGLFRPVFGEVVRAGRPVPSLAEMYRRGLRVVAEPGTRWRYTDHGFATLGQIVADVSGRPLAD